MLRGVTIWLALVGCAAAQDELLARFREKLARTIKNVPNYTCVETIERQRLGDPCRGCEYRDRLRLEVAVVDGRERFAWPGASRFGDQEIDEMVGGATGTGDFAGFAATLVIPDLASFTDAGPVRLYGRPAQCYRFRVPLDRSKYTLRSGARSAIVAYSGAVWFDPQTLDLLRLEVRADNIPVEQVGILKAGTTIEYEKMRIGAADFLLPQRSELYLASDNGISSYNRTSYSGCRQWIGQSTIHFEEEPAPASQPNQASTEVELPAGLTLELALQAPLNAARAAAGDPVTAAVDRAVRSGDLAIPKGALVHGRVKQLRYHVAPRSYTEVALEFTRLEFENVRAPLRAHLEQATRLFIASRPTEVLTGPDNTLLFGGKLGQIPKGYITVWKTIARSEENP